MTKLLLSIHSTMAIGLSSPELNLSEQEAQQLADAIKMVQECYSIRMSPQQEAWMNLTLTATAIYGYRVGAIYLRKSNSSSQQDKPENVNPEPKPNSGSKPINMGGLKFDPTNIQMPH